MLMTVQDIPGFRENNNTLTKVQSKQQEQQQQQQFNTNTIKRSQSYNSSREESIISNSNTLTKDRCIDIYDTSSTTTTLTPPASESGRDTPLQQNLTQQQQQQQQHLKNTQRELIMDLQHQSFAYPQSVRSELLSGSEDDETIPYHAREDSRPFSYGQVPQSPQNPPAGTMLKMQSGLSSPSLVRKQLGQPTVKKIEPRNDFEKMLRKRRDMVLNEKYSISDKQTSVDVGVGVNVNGKNNINSEKWFNTTNGNGYHYHEPLKRSNTMDGGFGRSNNSDG